MKKIFKSLFLLFISATLFAQAEFPYTVSLEPMTIDGLEGIHSYAYGQQDGKWIIIGGRLDGLHARQPFNSFPASENNTTIMVVSPETNEFWKASVEGLPTSLKEQLQSTNFQFFQDEDRLILIGGYSYSNSQEDHITHPYLTIIELPELTDAVINGDETGDYFYQIEDDAFAVTGGNLGKIGEGFYLVGGHRFDGRYNPMNHPTFTQAYTDAIRKFRLEKNGEEWTFGNYEVISDPVHLHRRDYNLLPQIYPDGQFGYTIFSGVFQINEDLPFLYPVDITADGHEPQTAFNQYLCNYHTSHIALHDATSNNMHNLFFGGISQYYYDGSNMVQDDNVPFVKTVSRVSRNADGELEEVRLPIEMPGYLGASAEFIPNENLPMAAPGIIDLSAITADSFLLGHIVGGIESQSLNPFAFNDTWSTVATVKIFKVFLKKTETTLAEDTTLPGYHGLGISVSPNPNSRTVFRITANAPEAGKIEIFLTDTTGKLLVNDSVDGLSKGKNTIEVEMDDPAKGLTFLTVLLNGKYSAVERLVFK